MLARRNFKDRYDEGKEISLREFLYPIMQGYDSVAVKADVEIGGNDQLFNLKAGRVLQEYYGMPKQSIITFGMLEGTDGRKMSTSWGNIITIVDEPFDMFGKVMALHDDLIIKYFLLTTDVSLEDIQKMEIELKEGVNPKDIKMKLASELVTMYHTEKDAALAKNSWIETFSNKGVIEEIVASSDKEIVDLLIEAKLVASKTEWRRLVDDNAVTDLEGILITNSKEKVKNVTLKIGKKRFIKIVVQD
jgi:tyrosyl-tRNA synthetase